MMHLSGQQSKIYLSGLFLGVILLIFIIPVLPDDVNLLLHLILNSILMIAAAFAVSTQKKIMLRLAIFLVILKWVAYATDNVTRRGRRALL